MKLLKQGLIAPLSGHYTDDFIEFSSVFDKKIKLCLYRFYGIIVQIYYGELERICLRNH
jgi:hypothetical protein